MSLKTFTFQGQGIINDEDEVHILVPLEFSLVLAEDADPNYAEAAGEVISHLILERQAAMADIIGDN